MKIISALILLLAVGAISCQKQENKPIGADYMIVGWTGGFAGFGVHNYYLISNGQVKKDVSKWNNAIPDDLSKFDFSLVQSAGKYDSVKDLLTSIPQELMIRNNADIGNSQPDAGFIDIRTAINGVKYRWAFEADQSGSSVAIQQFLAKAGIVFQ